MILDHTSMFKLDEMCREYFIRLVYAYVRDRTIIVHAISRTFPEIELSMFVVLVWNDFIKITTRLSGEKKRRMYYAVRETLHHLFGEVGIEHGRAFRIRWDALRPGTKGRKALKQAYSQIKIPSWDALGSCQLLQVTTHTHTPTSWRLNNKRHGKREALLMFHSLDESMLKFKWRCEYQTIIGTLRREVIQLLLVSIFRCMTANVGVERRAVSFAIVKEALKFHSMHVWCSRYLLWCDISLQARLKSHSVVKLYNSSLRRKISFRQSYSWLFLYVLQPFSCKLICNFRPLMKCLK